MGGQELSDFIDGFMKNENSEKELLKLFNLDETKLRQILQPAARLFLQINYFLKTGRILKDKESAVVMRNDMPQIDLEAIFDDKPIALNVLLKLLVTIIDHLSQNQYFLFKNLIKIPYNFQGMENIEIKYNHVETAFELYTLKNICLENYQSLRIEFKFSFMVEQMVIFEPNQDLTVITVDTAQPVPPNFTFIEVIIHSLIKENHSIQSGTKIGQSKICTLQTKCN